MGGICNRALTLRARREEYSLDLFSLPLQGREEREFLEGKLDAHLKNVSLPPSIGGLPRAFTIGWNSLCPRKRKLAGAFKAFDFDNRGTDGDIAEYEMH